MCKQADLLRNVVYATLLDSGTNAQGRTCVIIDLLVQGLTRNACTSGRTTGYHLLCCAVPINLNV